MGIFGSLLVQTLLSIRYPENNKIITHLTESEKMKLVNLATLTAKCYVEIGSYLGASSCFIAEGIKKSRQKGKLYCIDTWQNDAMSEGMKDTFNEFSKNVSKYKEIIVPLKGHSTDIAKNFERSIDFLFIDGDHSYNGVKADADAWFPKLKHGALVVFHDIGWSDGVQRVIREDVKPMVVKEGRLPNLYWAWLK